MRFISTLLATIVIIKQMKTDFNDFTVQEFQEWHKAINTDMDLMDREYKLLSICAGISEDKAMSIPNGKVIEMFRKMNKLKLTEPSKKVKPYMSIGWRPYKAIVMPSELEALMSANQFTTAITYSKTTESSIENLHRLLALIYTPYYPFTKPKIAENQGKLAKTMLKAKIGDVYGVVFFYSIVSPKLQEAFQQFSHQNDQVIMNHLKEMAVARGVDLSEITDGITQ